MAVSQDGAGGQGEFGGPGGGGGGVVLDEEDLIIEWFKCVRCHKDHMRRGGGGAVVADADICKQCGGEDCCVGDMCGVENFPG